MERPEQLRLLGGIALGVGATLAVLQLLGVNLSAAPAGGKQHLEGQLVNRSLLQKRHAFHADVVDDDDDLSSEDESGGGRGKKGDKGAGGKGEGEAASWQEKEDSLIRLLFDLMRDRNIPLKDACEISEHLIYEHLAGVSTDLAAVAPELVQPSARASATRHLHSALPLSEAFRKYDSQTHVSSRKKVPPQFREVRNIVNLAQVLASATAGLKLITFDGDGTLYPDRTVLDDELEERPGTPGLIGEEPPRNPDTTPGALITRLMGLLEAGVTVALVTAVGDPRPEPFEKRMIGLIRRIQRRGPGAKPVSLYAVGGQCNYVRSRAKK
uniref:IMP-specific 5'-nucleotidase 1 n=1 Tax=Phaeomonas parva TaxID=124430 RepID=A0A7S1UE07_9STRA|mmetsp:Transcript_43457/g.136260  ORF Transcript_43457/g.136260 Transcript_43457/m.136260 type:complete len:326 (+) Transcript_43457:151-1128(+)